MSEEKLQNDTNTIYTSDVHQCESEPEPGSKFSSNDTSEHRELIHEDYDDEEKKEIDNISMTESHKKAEICDENGA